MTVWPPGGAGTMLRLVRDLPQQLAQSEHLEGLSALQPAADRPSRVLLCGMGGSAIAGDLIQPLLADADLSFSVQRDYRLPGWVDSHTLVVAGSYSGNTEETLSCVADARRRGCPLVAITSGGALLDISRGAQPFPVVLLPPGLPPRASLGLGLGVLLRVLGALGLVAGVEQQMAAAIFELEAGNRRHLVDLDDAEHLAETNSPYALARTLCDTIPVIYTTSAEAHGAGVRLKAQLNENGKHPACCVPFPELDHNDIVGWFQAPGGPQRYVLLILRGGDEDERTALRVTVTCELLADEFGSLHEIRAHGEHTLARVMSLVQYGDYLSTYLALHKDVDPVPVERIESLKKRLEEGSH